MENFSDAGIDETKSDSGTNNGSNAATSDAGIDEPELDSDTNNGSNAATEWTWSPRQRQNTMTHTSSFSRLWTIGHWDKGMRSLQNGR